MAILTWCVFYAILPLVAEAYYEGCACSRESYRKLQNVWGKSVWRRTTLIEKADIFDGIFHEMDKFLPGIKEVADTAGGVEGKVPEQQLLMYRVKGLHWYDMAINLLHDYDLLKSHMSHYMKSHPGWGAPGPAFLAATRKAFSSVMGTLFGPEICIISNDCFHTIHQAYIEAARETEVYAECCVNCETDDNITGKITMSQMADGKATTIRINLSGFPPGERKKLHGFHIHEHGSLGNSCKDAGGHFNPYGNQHGDQEGSPYGQHQRHVGDLGNIYVDETGIADTVKVDDDVWIVGPTGNSVLNRAIVIHAGEDDLGLGDTPGSKTTGNAGARIACCVIKHVKYPRS